MRIPLWWWRMRYPKDFWQCEHGYWWINEDSTEKLGFRKLLAASHSLQPYRPTAREYLGKGDLPHKEFLRANGEVYTAPSFEKVESWIVAGLMQRPTWCYANSLEMGKHIQDSHPNDEVLYAEGTAVDPTGAHPHAWILVNGEVVDLTWTTSFLASYHGVAFSLEEASRLMKLGRCYGVFNDWDTNDEKRSETLAWCRRQK